MEGEPGQRDIPSLVPPEAVVMRFRPTEPARVLARAAEEYRFDSGKPGLIPHYGLSVWVRTPEGDESLLETLKKLAADADVTWANQRKVFVATRAERLMDEGFEFFKDCFEGEPEAHYCVRLPALEAAAVDRFLQAFDAEHSVADLGVTDDSR